MNDLGPLRKLAGSLNDLNEISSIYKFEYSLGNQVSLVGKLIIWDFVLVI